MTIGGLNRRLEEKAAGSRWFAPRAERPSGGLKPPTDNQALKTGLPADLLLLMQVGAFMQVPGLPGYRLIVQRGNRWDVDPPQAPGATERRPRAWIVETGGRLGPLRERRIAWTERLPFRTPPGAKETPGLFPSLDKEGWREAPGWFDPAPTSQRHELPVPFHSSATLPE